MPRLPSIQQSQSHKPELRRVVPTHNSCITLVVMKLSLLLLAAAAVSHARLFDRSLRPKDHDHDYDHDHDHDGDDFPTPPTCPDGSPLYLVDFAAFAPGQEVSLHQGIEFGTVGDNTSLPTIVQDPACGPTLVANGTLAVTFSQPLYLYRVTTLDPSTVGVLTMDASFWRLVSDKEFVGPKVTHGVYQDEVEALRVWSSGLVSMEFCDEIVTHPPSLAPTFEPSFAPTRITLAPIPGLAPESPTTTPITAKPVDSTIEPTAVTSTETTEPTTPTLAPTTMAPTPLKSLTKDPTTQQPTALAPTTPEPTSVGVFPTSVMPTFGVYPEPTTTMPTFGTAAEPTAVPSVGAVVETTAFPTFGAVAEPTSEPSLPPSQVPSSQPTLESGEPSLVPSLGPSMEPSLEPSTKPTVWASTGPSVLASLKPTISASMSPSQAPSLEPTTSPIVEPMTPSLGPSVMLSGEPTSEPTPPPTKAPTSPAPVYATATMPPLASCPMDYTRRVIDFNSLEHGHYMMDPMDGYSFVLGGGAGFPRVYDSTTSHDGGDPDLEADVGNVLIIQNATQDVPNDSRFGGSMQVTFPRPMYLLSVTVLDTEVPAFVQTKLGGMHVAQDRGSALQDGQVGTILVQEPSVDYFRLRIKESGAMVNFAVCIPPEPTLAPALGATTLAPEPCPLGYVHEVVNFDGYAHGDWIEAPVHGFAFALLNSLQGPPRIYDTNTVRDDGDPDLQVNVGNALIVQNATVSYPNDSRDGGSFLAYFPHPGFVQSVTFIDTEEWSSIQTKIGGKAGVVVDKMQVPRQSDGSVTTVSLTNQEHVDFLRVRIGGSGALASFEACLVEP